MSDTELVEKNETEESEEKEESKAVPEDDAPRKKRKYTKRAPEPETEDAGALRRIALDTDEEHLMTQYMDVRKNDGKDMPERATITKLIPYFLKMFQYLKRIDKADDWGFMVHVARQYLGCQDLASKRRIDEEMWQRLKPVLHLISQIEEVLVSLEVMQAAIQRSNLQLHQMNQMLVYQSQQQQMQAMYRAMRMPDFAMMPPQAVPSGRFAEPSPPPRSPNFYAPPLTSSPLNPQPPVLSPSFVVPDGFLEPPAQSVLGQSGPF